MGAAAESLLKRFIREARLAAQIDHPNITRVMNVGSEGPLHFIIMEFIDGHSAVQIPVRTLVLIRYGDAERGIFATAWTASARVFTFPCCSRSGSEGSSFSTAFPPDPHMKQPSSPQPKLGRASQ